MLKALRIPKDLFQHILLVLLLEIFLFLGLAIGNIWNGSEAIAAPVKPTLVAYDIDKEIDRQRKEATQEHYGEDAGKVVNEALANNEESSNSKYKIKQNEPLKKKASKVIQQVKDKGLVDVDRKDRS